MLLSLNTTQWIPVLTPHTVWNWSTIIRIIWSSSVCKLTRFPSIFAVKDKWTPKGHWRMFCFINCECVQSAHYWEAGTIPVGMKIKKKNTGGSQSLFGDINMIIYQKLMKLLIGVTFFNATGVTTVYFISGIFYVYFIFH